MRQSVGPVSRIVTNGARTVAVIGGGISGLVAAYRLSMSGAAVTLYEAADRFGGLGTQFEHDGHPFDRFYHVILPTDEGLLSLAADLGIHEHIYWEETSLGFVYQGQMYRLDGPLDLLRFKAVPFLHRIRLGLTALWAAHVARPDRLDDMTVAEWLRRLSGDLAFERLWRPLLEAKFGDAYDRIPALWYWAHFRREKGTKKEIKGYPRGGYAALAGHLIEAARSAGAELNTGSPVERVSLRQLPGDPGEDASVVELELAGGTREFDQVFFCTPFAAIPRLADPETLGPSLANLPLDLDHQGVINVLLMLRRSLTSHYWIPVVDSGVPFRGIVETTNVIREADADGRHIVYLLNYVHRDSNEYQRSDEEIVADYVGGLLELFPDLGEADIDSTHVFRTPYVEPIWTPGYSRRLPAAELVPGRVFMATTAQIYPRVTSWNSSIELASRVAEQASRT